MYTFRLHRKKTKFMTRHMNNLHVAVQEMRQRASLMPEGLLNHATHTCTLSADACMASKTLLPGLFSGNPLCIGNMLKCQAKFLQSCLYALRGSWAAPGSKALLVQLLSLQHHVSTAAPPPGQPDLSPTPSSESSGQRRYTPPLGLGLRMQFILPPS